MCACFQTKLTKMISCRWSGGLSVNKEYCAGNHNSRGHKKSNSSLKSNLCTSHQSICFATELQTLSDETKKFHRDRYQYFFSRPKFSRPRPRLFFETKYFRDRYRDFFSKPNVFETDTETFFRDQIF